MALNYERIMAYRPADIAVAYGTRDCILYALGIGLGMDPLDPGQLKFVYERAGLEAFPTMAVVIRHSASTSGSWSTPTSRWCCIGHLRPKGSS
jgi:hypothetical protein